MRIESLRLTRLKRFDMSVNYLKRNVAFVGDMLARVTFIPQNL